MPQKNPRTSKKRRKEIEDNPLLDERENVDLLDTIEGIDYDENQFRQDFPHLAGELGDPELNYPMDAVRWEDEVRAREELIRPEEPTVESLLRRSKTKEEAVEIINYLEKRGEISLSEAKKLRSALKTRGLKAFKQ